MAIAISSNQLKKLNNFAFDSYIIELMEHCKKYFPYLNNIMTEAQLKEILKEAVEKAKKNGFTQRGSVQFYIDMMIMFGVGFMDDPQYPWILENLRKNAELTEIEQADELFFICNDYLRQISGEQDKYQYIVANNLESFSLDKFDLNNQHTEQQLLNIFEEIYSEKAQYTSESELRELVVQGTNRAYSEYHYKRVDHNGLFVILMYLYGHQFDKDPFLPFRSVINRQNSENILDRNAKKQIAQQLESFVRQWGELKIK